MLEIIVYACLLMPRRPLLKKYRFTLAVLMFAAISSGMIKEGRGIVYLAVGIVGAFIQLYSLRNISTIVDFSKMIQGDEIKSEENRKIKLALIGMLLLSFFVILRGVFVLLK